MQENRSFGPAVSALRPAAPAGIPMDIPHCDPSSDIAVRPVSACRSSSPSVCCPECPDPPSVFASLLPGAPRARHLSLPVCCPERPGPAICLCQSAPETPRTAICLCRSAARNALGGHLSLSAPYCGLPVCLLRCFSPSVFAGLCSPVGVCVRRPGRILNASPLSVMCVHRKNLHDGVFWSAIFGDFKKNA